MHPPPHSTTKTLLIHAFFNCRADMSLGAEFLEAQLPSWSRGTRASSTSTQSSTSTFKLFQSSTGDCFLDIEYQENYCELAAPPFSKNFNSTNINYSTFANLTKTAQQQPTTLHNKKQTMTYTISQPTAPTPPTNPPPSPEQHEFNKLERNLRDFRVDIDANRDEDE